MKQQEQMGRWDGDREQAGRWAGKPGGLMQEA